MGDRWPTRLLQQVADMPLVWIVLWLGLAGLSVALIVLTRTNWGQSRPLHKCAVLSILAHVLLACFATTVRIVSSVDGHDNRSAIQITMEDVAAESEADPMQMSPASDPAEPWDIPPPGSPVDPWTTPSTRSDIVPAPADPQSPTRQAELRSTQSPQQREENETDLEIESELDRFSDTLATARTKPAEAGVVAQAARPPAENHAVPSSKNVRPSDARVHAPEPSTSQASSSDDPIEVPANSANETDRTASSGGSRPSVSEPLEPTTERAAASTRPLTPVRRDASAATRNNPSAGVDVENRASVRHRDEAVDRTQPSAPQIYKNRLLEDRSRIVAANGGSPDTEAAVEAALEWLAGSQSSDGRWDADQHGAGRDQHVLGHHRNHAGRNADTGISGLALLAFLGAGHTHQQGDHRETVRRGLEFLASQQSEDGSLAGQSSLFARTYCHGIACFALSEALAMTSDQELRPAVENGVRFSLAAQNRNDGGWRYRPGDPGDTSQLGWQVMALKSAQLAKIEIPSETVERVRRFLKSVAAGSHGGLASYRPHGAVSPTMTAEALFCRQMIGGPALHRSASDQAAHFLLRELPGQSRPNLYYWYYATLGLYQVQGESWQRWNDALKSVLLTNQRLEGTQAGSWDPNTQWGGYGGRVYSTAMAALCLEVYYRYLPLYEEVARSQGHQFR